MTTDGVNLRELVLDILLSVTKGEAYSHIALAAVLDKYQYLTKQERGFITRLTEGVLERMIELDYMIDQFSNLKTSKMKPVVRCILRMGVYQLKYMDTVPDSAACNEAVKLAAKKGLNGLKGFVNGVLRNIGRNLDKICYPDEGDQPIHALSVQYSMPEWILSQWIKDYGIQKAKSVAASFMCESRTAIRINPMKCSTEQLNDALNRQGIAAERIYLEGYPDFDYAMYISGYDYLASIPEFNAGWFMVQDVSSMLAAHTAAPRPGSYVIDVCAAPGAKSLHAAELMRGQGIVEARDLTEYKVSLIEENIARCGFSNIRAIRHDARILDEAAVAKADVVLADLPCSGLGVLKKKPEIRYRMTEAAQRGLAALQQEILSVSCRYVKPGGVFLYSTYTINRMENEENTRRFLEGHERFSLVGERQFFPDEGEMDGFYIAKFVLG